jgi:hypothetical protein
VWEPFGESDEEALIDEVLQVLPHGVTETEGVELPVAVEVEVNVATVDALAVDVVELVEVPVQTEVAVAEPVCAEEAVTALLEVELQLLSPVTVGGGEEVGGEVCVAAPVAVTAPVLLEVPVAEGIPDELPVRAEDAVAESVPLALVLPLAVKVAPVERVLVVDPDRVGELVDDSEEAALPDSDCVLVAVLDCVAVAPAESVLTVDPEMVGVEEDDWVAVVTAVNVRNGVPVALPVSVAPPVSVCVGAPVRDNVAVAVLHSEGRADWVPVALPVSVAPPVSVCVGAPVREAVAVAVLQTEGAPEELPVAELVAGVLSREVAVTLSVNNGVPDGDGIAENDSVGTADAVLLPVAAALVDTNEVPEALEVKEWPLLNDAEAVEEEVPVVVADPDPLCVDREDHVALAVADMEGVALLVQRSCRGSHALLTAQAGDPSSRVHAGPSATPPGHHVPPTPHPCGASTARCAMGANVNTDEAAHAAVETPLQVSDVASHWRPDPHSVAERGPA